MNSNWAEENLQTIRTLMERSALYRRALAPIMLLAGILGILAGAAGFLFHLNSFLQFQGLWLGTAVIALAGSFFIARKQAIKDQEIFWSSPTRRVAEALIPFLAVGFFLGTLVTFWGTLHGDAFNFDAPPVWVLFYGCALYAAGFFMPRGMKVFGLLFMAFGCGLFAIILVKTNWLDDMNPHLLMGFFFGLLHLAYGIYLYFTEKKNPVA